MKTAQTMYTDAVAAGAAASAAAFVNRLHQKSVVRTTAAAEAAAIAAVAMWVFCLSYLRSLLIFDLSFDLSQYPRVSLLNERDGRSSEYYFTASDQLRYFVQTENTNRFMVYTYFPNGQLKSVKHCMNPLDDHHSCLYYTFTYEHSRIFSTNTYYLKNSIDSVKKANLIRRDLLSYNIHHEPSSIQSMDSLNQEIDSYAFSIIRSDRGETLI